MAPAPGAAMRCGGGVRAPAAGVAACGNRMRPSLKSVGMADIEGMACGRSPDMDRRRLEVLPSALRLGPVITAAALLAAPPLFAVLCMELMCACTVAGENPSNRNTPSASSERAESPSSQR
eukprot:360680-Chlamydomonas_euryale.AAC.7